jgi:hypothetical protein
MHIYIYIYSHSVKLFRTNQTNEQWRMHISAVTHFIRVWWTYLLKVVQNIADSHGCEMRGEGKKEMTISRISPVRIMILPLFNNINIISTAQRRDFTHLHFR